MCERDRSQRVRRREGIPGPRIAAIPRRWVVLWMSLFPAFIPLGSLAQESSGPPGAATASSGVQEGSQPSLQARLEALGERIETLRPRVETAQRAARRADAIRADSVRRASQIPLDTVRVGPLRIVTIPDQLELAETAFSEVWQVFEPLLEGSEGLLAGHLFAFRYGWRLDEMYLGGDQIQSVEMNRRYGMDRLREKIRDGLGHVMVQALPPEAASIREWVGRSPLTPPLTWSWIYRELASTPSTAVRKCYRGEVARCWDGLGLSTGEGGWKEWYTPEERRLLVKARFGNRTVTDGMPLRSMDLLVHGCLGLGVDRACLEILEEVPGAIPLSVSARASMVAEALSLGGNGAFARMVSSPDTSIVGRLTYAAQLPADTLASRWRERVLRARPRTQAGLLLSPVSMGLWILLLLFLATRSTRWRLG